MSDQDEDMISEFDAVIKLINFPNQYEHQSLDVPASISYHFREIDKYLYNTDTNFTVFNEHMDELINAIKTSDKKNKTISRDAILSKFEIVFGEEYYDDHFPEYKSIDTLRKRARSISTNSNTSSLSKCLHCNKIIKPLTKAVNGKITI